jgi:LAO/AO transport system kinase
MILELEKFEAEIKNESILYLSKAITLAESTLDKDNAFIEQLINRNKDRLGRSVTIAISGIPGVGKSTFIEAFGAYIHQMKKKIAVLTIDPSSERTKGSILGDKTRMNQLSNLNQVFIRPSPSSNQLGGLGRNTQKSVALCELAGYEIILIETVGVGQSETIVQHLCDLFMLIVMPASGDELQGVKKGIMEVADIFVINKADGELKNKAIQAKSQIENALHLTRDADFSNDQITICSSIEHTGIDIVWSQVSKLIQSKKDSHLFQKKRMEQKLFWFEYELKEKLWDAFVNKHSEKIEELKKQIKDGDYISIYEILEKF